MVPSSVILMSASSEASTSPARSSAPSLELSRSSAGACARRLIPESALVGVLAISTLLSLSIGQEGKNPGEQFRKSLSADQGCPDTPEPPLGLHWTWRNAAKRQARNEP